MEEEHTHIATRPITGIKCEKDKKECIGENAFMIGISIGNDDGFG